MPIQILIADDQRAQRHLLGSLVLYLGGKPGFASDGEEAVQMATESAYDIVFLDLSMPKLDGLLAADRILHHWKDKEGERPRLVAITGHNTAEMKEVCRATGLDGFVGKPHGTTLLKKTLQDLVTRGYSWPDAPGERLLHIEQLDRAVKINRAAFELACRKVLEDLESFARGKNSRDEGFSERLVSMQAFALKYGFVRLHTFIAQQVNEDASELTDLKKLMAGEAKEFDRAWKAARLWLPERATTATRPIRLSA